MSKREADGYCAQNRDGDWMLYTMSYDSSYATSILHDQLDASGEEQEDAGWQIRPVWLSTEPPEEWISVSERLPEEEGYYWGDNGDEVFLVDFTPDAICKDGIFDCDGFSIGEDNLEAGTIIAWMKVRRPLPPKPEGK